MFHQSGGCCDGSSPMCYPLDEFITGDADVQLGVLDIGSTEPVGVWMGRRSSFGADSLRGVEQVASAPLAPSTGG